MSATGIAGYWSLFEPRVPGFIHIPAPYPCRAATPDESVSALEAAIVREGADASIGVSRQTSCSLPRQSRLAMSRSAASA